MGSISRRFAITVVLGGFLMAAALACRAEERPLQVGDPVPEFKCQDNQGRTWDSREHIGKRIVVIYFYPSDFAFCCTRQALSYCDLQDCLADWGVDLIGVSGDSVQAHRLFKETHQLNFSLLADVDGRVARGFGVPLRVGGKAMIVDVNGKAVVGANGMAVSVPRAVTAARWTYIIGRDGRIIYQVTEVSPAKDSQEVMEFLCNRPPE